MMSNLPIAAPCLVVLVGPPGSGKTTWAQRNARGAVHVSQDGLIGAITPAGFDHAYRPIYSEAENAVARAALHAGYTVIVDRTNRTRAHRERWVRMARQAAVPAVAVAMTAPHAVCRDRNARREPPNRLSEERMDRMFAAQEPVRIEEGFVSVYFEAGDGPGIELAEILSQLRIKEQLSHEYCYQAR
jgi:predicted kinase